MNYYSFHIGDFSAHTRHLSLLEELAYRRLLDAYYLAERPFNGCSTDVAREIGMIDQLPAVEYVLEKFFILSDGVYRNKRCDAEIAKYADKKEKASNAGRASAERRLNVRSTSVEKNPTSVEILATDVQPTNNQEPITKNQVGKPISSDAVASLPTRSEKAPTRFAEFWAAWPRSDRKTAKAKCEERWRKLKLDLVADAILAHVAACKQSQNWLDGYDPAPLRYIGERRWEDGELPVAGYSASDLEVFEKYNATLASAGWPEVSTDVFSSERASSVSQFLGFSQRENWVDAYFGWMGENLQPRPGCGFDWVIRKDTFLRAKEGNFSALKDAA